MIPKLQKAPEQPAVVRVICCEWIRPYEVSRDMKYAIKHVCPSCGSIYEITYAGWEGPRK